MVADGTQQPTDQSSTRLSADELARKTRDAGRDPLAVTSLFNPDNTFSAMRGTFDPRMTGNMPGLQGLSAMMGPFLAMFAGFIQSMGNSGPSTPAGPGTNTPQVTQSPYVMAQNFSPRGPSG